MVDEKHQKQLAWRRTWRKKNKDRCTRETDQWRAKHPGWWNAYYWVKSLNKALVERNPRSKIWLQAQIPAAQWFQSFSKLNGEPISLLIALSNGSKLAPVKSWLDFKLEKPSQVRKFLHPSNFKVVKKGSPQ